MSAGAYLKNAHQQVSPYLKTAGEFAVQKKQEFDAYVEQAPHVVNLMCSLGGVLVVTHAIWKVFNYSTFTRKFIWWLMNIYQVFFGLVTFVVELHPDAHPSIHEHLQSWQEWMHEWAKGLTMLWGRGLFYIFQGTLILVGTPGNELDWISIFIGLYMTGMGIICFSLHYKARQNTKKGGKPYIQVA